VISGHPLFSLRLPGFVVEGAVVEKEIYLTFDDGPVPVRPEFVLDQLEKARAQGDFFLHRRQRDQKPAFFRTRSVKVMSLQPHPLII